MKTRITLLLFALLLAVCASALADVAPQGTYAPLSWEARVAECPPHPEGFSSLLDAYHDDSLDVRIETMRRNDTTVMLVYVQLTDPSQIRSELSQRFPSKQATVVPTLARRVKAPLAINGDYFIYHDEGIVVRNGKTLRFKPTTKRDTLIIDENGDLTILAPTTREAWEAWEAQGHTAIHAFCFGPGLVMDGTVLDDADSVKVNLGPNKRTQRIALGQTGPLEYLIIATEGPDNVDSKGFTITEMAQLCADMGCINAYNLDGGSSASVVMNYEKVNALSTGKVRPVGDCIWFASLAP